MAKSQLASLKVGSRLCYLNQTKCLTEIYNKPYSHTFLIFRHEMFN